MTTDLFARLVEVDAQLGLAGFPRMSPFWRETSKRFLRSKKRWLVGRVGRRGGKGVHSAKLAATFAAHCPLHNLTPGERAYVELLSVDREEASARLGMIARALDALGIPHRVLAEEIQLTDPSRPVTIRVRAASVRAVGGTAILILLDEVARWRDAATGANPAHEIYAAIKAELLSQPEGRGCLFSAPYGENDLHAEMFDQGETDGAAVAYSPTWEANPSISEADTRALESNPAIWEREYLARPTAHVTAIASKAEIAARTAKGVERRPRIPGARYLATMDPSGLRNDAWVVAIWCMTYRAGPEGRVVDVIQQVALARWAPAFWRKPTFDGCVADTVALCRDYGVTRVFSDGHFYEAIRPRLAEHGIGLVQTAQTSAAITTRIETLQARIGNGSIELLDHEEQSRELGAAQLVTHAGGRKTLRAPERRGAHDDTVSCILLACDGETAVRLPPTDGGDVLVKHGPISFEAGVGVTTTAPRYFRRLANGDLESTEPPYATTAWCRWASASAARLEYSPTMLRYLKERGLDDHPSADPERFLPDYAERLEARRRR